MLIGVYQSTILCNTIYYLHTTMKVNVHWEILRNFRCFYLTRNERLHYYSQGTAVHINVTMKHAAKPISIIQESISDINVELI